MVEHQDVGLLHDLRAMHSIGAQEQIGGDRSPGCDVPDEERLELEEPRELLVDAGRRVQTIDECVGELAPMP